MRELIWVVNGKNKQLWSVASTMMCLTANVNRDPKKRAFKPSDFNPYFVKSKKEQAVLVDENNIGLLRQAFGVR